MGSVDVQKRFSLILNDLLSKKNLSMTDFAHLIGVKSQTTIKNWLNDEGGPSWKQLVLIKEKLQLTDIRTLFGIDVENLITMSKYEFDESILKARLEEARRIAIETKQIPPSSPDTAGTAGPKKGVRGRFCGDGVLEKIADDAPKRAD